MALPGTPSTPLTIPEVPRYTQKSPGDVGYISPDKIDVVLGSTEFTVKAMRMRLTELINFGASASESDRVTGLTEHEYTKTFAAPYLTIPVITVLSVYKMVLIETGKWVRQDVQFYYPVKNWLTVNGFTIVIEASESLAGVIIEYKFN